ncbi:MAG: hypothetical protein Q4A17_04160, partial [Thermoguttaceae bacterium]|nr:hypothetical protein [Thermoguttaceae bacterium]
SAGPCGAENGSELQGSEVHTVKPFTPSLRLDLDGVTDSSDRPSDRRTEPPRRPALIQRPRPERRPEPSPS